MEENNISQQELYEKYKPLSPWAYLGYNLLFCIPFVNIILLIILSFAGQNTNRKNYARAFILYTLILTVLVIFLGLFIFYESEKLTNSALNSVNSITVTLTNTQIETFVGNNIRGTSVKQLFTTLETIKSQDINISIEGIQEVDDIEDTGIYEVSVEYDPVSGYINLVKIHEI